MCDSCAVRLRGSALMISVIYYYISRIPFLQISRNNCRSLPRSQCGLYVCSASRRPTTVADRTKRVPQHEISRILFFFSLLYRKYSRTRESERIRKIFGFRTVFFRRTSAHAVVVEFYGEIFTRGIKKKKEIDAVALTDKEKKSLFHDTVIVNVFGFYEKITQKKKKRIFF